MQEYTYKTKQIKIHEVDYMGDYQLCHLFNEFSEIATQNAIQIGLWKQDMINQYGWIVAKQSLHLNQPIQLNDIIELSTIAGKGSHVAFPRYYFIKKDNQVIGQCSSIWTLIDLHKRRMTSPKRIGLHIPEMTHHIYLSEPKSPTIPKNMHLHMTRQVLYSDIDTNQHMNNTRYIQWAMDCLQYDLLKDAYVSDLTIHYKKEIKPLQYVQLFIGKDSPYSYVIEGRDHDEIFFTIEMTMTKR